VSNYSHHSNLKVEALASDRYEESENGEKSKTDRFKRRDKGGFMIPFSRFINYFTKYISSNMGGLMRAFGS
jgi:hypothetical protein